MFTYVFLSIVAAAIASHDHVHVNSGCPDVKPMENFNLISFGTGRWYEVARYPNSIENGGECGWADYNLDGDVFTVKNYDVSKGKLRSVVGSARLADDAGNTGKLTYSYPYGAGGAITNSTLWVLGTDYQNYAVVYYCKYDEDKKTRQDFNWVFSRYHGLTYTPRTAVDKILKDNTFLDSTKLIWPEFSEETCYATGKWYEAARYPNDLEKDGNCGWSDFVLKGDVFSVKNYDIVNSKLRTVDGSAQLANDAVKTGKLVFSYPYGVDGATTKNTLWVLGTDYDNYAVVYYCKYDEDKKTRQDFSWVLSRSKKFEGDAKAAADKIVKDNTFLDSSKLIWPDFSEDACTFIEPF